MSPFELATLPPDAFEPAAIQRRMGCTFEAAEALVAFNLTQIVYMNDEYQVNVTDAEVGQHWPPMHHLSIKRIDKAPIHDWRVMQAIKNAILSPEHEAVELYPAESRLTDTANQYHLFALKSSGMEFPFGFFDGRNVCGTVEAGKTGAVQREVQP